MFLIIFIYLFFSVRMDIEGLMAFDDLPISSASSSWTELMQNVCNLRQRVSSLSTTTAVPSNLDFRLLSDGRIRIYFLCSPNTGWETTLLYVDILPNDTGNVRSASHPSIHSSIHLSIEYKYIL